jgi:hypothetical protein
MLLTRNPGMMAKRHARHWKHHAQVMQVGPREKAHCLDCGARWFNVEAAAEAAVEATYKEDR